MAWLAFDGFPDRHISPPNINATWAVGQTMYALAIVLLMLVLPIGSILAENAHLQGTVPLLALIGKWFVWGSG